MGLLLHTNVTGTESLPLKPGYPRKYPFTQMVNRVLIDQIDPFHYTSVCLPISDILKLPQNPLSFGEMAEKRATEMKKFDAPIYIMYSGGVDSSSALIAFLQTWSDAELERVFVLASQHSVSEFPQMWNVVVSKFGTRILSSFKPVETYCRKGYVITGEHGDQLFGSDIIKAICRMFGNEGIHSPWEDIMPPVYCAMWGDVDAALFVERYKLTLSYCPFPIKTAFDWIWWFNFTNKWQHVKFRLLANKPWIDPRQNFPRIHHFYDTAEWQRWSIDHHDEKIGLTYDTYKLAAKKYIVGCTGFTEYMKKPKVGSLCQIWRSRDFFEALDTDYNPLTREQVLEYVR